ncbi:MAG: hypothetical protein R2783_05075 [Gelidibacter sp.]
MLIKKTTFHVAVLFCFYSIVSISQNQKKADSLIAIYKSGTYKDNVLELLNNIAFNETNPDVTLQYCELLIGRATDEASIYFLQKAYAYKGDALQLKGDYVQANNAFFKSLEYANKLKDQTAIGRATIFHCQYLFHDR